MSHFITGVIIPEGSEVEETVEGLLSHYDENIEVEPYDHQPCSCEGKDPKCYDCKGTGTSFSTYNPDSKWDWWKIGGRWDGWPNEDTRSKDWPAPRYNEHDNVHRIEDLLNMDLPYVPFAIVTPDGAWHEKGKMGWFGMVSDEKDTWTEECMNILRKYADHLIVIVDCHI
jgi:hypothetical protein